MLKNNSPLATQNVSKPFSRVQVGFENIHTFPDKHSTCLSAVLERKLVIKISHDVVFARIAMFLKAHKM